jgi:hypothetical protein
MDDPRHLDRLLRLVEHGTHEVKIDARNQLGELYFEREQWNDAAECFERNIKDGVRTPETLGALAMVRIEQGRSREAGRLMHAACELADKERRRGERATTDARRSSQLGDAWQWLVHPFGLLASFVAAVIGRRQDRSNQLGHREQ